MSFEGLLPWWLETVGTSPGRHSECICCTTDLGLCVVFGVRAISTFLWPGSTTGGVWQSPEEFCLLIALTLLGTDLFRSIHFSPQYHVEESPLLSKTILSAHVLNASLSYICNVLL